MMKVNETEIEVRYQETDQMGVVYHANYLIWFEIGRTKYMEQLGFRYAQLEEMGIISPVLSLNITYKKPAAYGDKVMIQTWLHAYNGVRTIYGYTIKNEQGDILVTGSTEHTIVQKASFKPVRLRNVHPAMHEEYKKQGKGKDIWHSE